MKKIVIAIALITGANFSYAQQQSVPQQQNNNAQEINAHRPPDPKAIMEQAKKETEALNKRLKLTDEQQSKITNVNMNIDHQIAMVKIQDNNPEHLRQLEMIKQNEYRRILTPDQAAQYEQIIHEQQARPKQPQEAK